MKLFARIKGGLGNQLFCYAAARRLALVNNAELLLDHVTGFERDAQYNRRFRLNRFSIPVRLAAPSERFYPFERPRRGLAKAVSRLQPFERRKYIFQEFPEYDRRLLALKLTHYKTTIDGLWQSESYFRDIAPIIRNDLQVAELTGIKNVAAKNWIAKNNAVAIHVRWFGASNSLSNVPLCYYQHAISKIYDLFEEPHFALFSDSPIDAVDLLRLPKGRTLEINWNNHDSGEVDDLCLMISAKRFIIANSTFSWWGAWLGATDLGSVVFFPRLNTNRHLWAWDYEGQMPNEWHPVLV